jgi:hypothetical protein
MLTSNATAAAKIVPNTWEEITPQGRELQSRAGMESAGRGAGGRPEGRSPFVCPQPLPAPSYTSSSGGD